MSLLHVSSSFHWPLHTSKFKTSFLPLPCHSMFFHFIHTIISWSCVIFFPSFPVSIFLWLVWFSILYLLKSIPGPSCGRWDNIWEVWKTLSSLTGTLERTSEGVLFQQVSDRFYFVFKEINFLHLICYSYHPFS